MNTAWTAYEHAREAVKIVEGQLDDARDARRKTLLAFLQERWGLILDQTIVTCDGKRYVFAGLPEAHWMLSGVIIRTPNQKPTITAIPLKKDGSRARQLRTLYQWDVEG